MQNTVKVYSLILCIRMATGLFYEQHVSLRLCGENRKRSGRFEGSEDGTEGEGMRRETFRGGGSVKSVLHNGQLTCRQ